MKSVLDSVEQLFKQQIADWPMLARGIEGLARAKTRQVHVGAYDIFVRHIPHRAVSSTARVDKASIEQRPCFLCAINMPPEQKGMEYDGEFSFFCNPFPIFDRHVTIVHREHQPQRIAGHVPALLGMAKALPGYFVVYNGPECGASAPDHLHFQACLRTLFPIERDLANRPGPGIEDYGRRVVVLRDADAGRLVARIDGLISTLARVTLKNEDPSVKEPQEPMLNIAAFHDASTWTVFVFPRGKHRPAVFHTGELTVSPGTIDMCGVFVLPYEEDFMRIQASHIEQVLNEVTLPGDQFREVIGLLDKAR